MRITTVLIKQHGVIEMLRIYRYILDISSFILIVLLVLYLITGYVILEPGSRHGFKGFNIYSFSVWFHRSILARWLLILSMDFHGVSGFTLMAFRVRNRLLRDIIVIFIHLFFMLLTIVFLILEIT